MAVSWRDENKESDHCFVALPLPSRALRNRPKTLETNIYEIKTLEFCFPKQLSSMNLFVAEAQSSGPTMGGEDMVRELERLQLLLQEREDAIACAICMENEKNVVFLCGHMACSICSDRLQVCHICRVEIQNRVQVFRWPTREVRSMCTRREITCFGKTKCTGLSVALCAWWVLTFHLIIGSKFKWLNGSLCDFSRPVRGPSSKSLHLR